MKYREALKIAYKEVDKKKFRKRDGKLDKSMYMRAVNRRAKELVNDNFDVKLGVRPSKRVTFSSSKKTKTSSSTKKKTNKKKPQSQWGGEVEETNNKQFKVVCNGMVCRRVAY